MSYINFRNNGAQLGFQNALNMGLQFGAQAAESANRRGFNNALAGYDPNNPDSFKEVAKYDPRVAIQLRRDAQRQQAAAEKSGLEGLTAFRPLLEQAAQGPEQYAEAYRAGAEAGYDMSKVPQQYDPQWVQRQIMIIDAAESGELPGLAKEVMLALPEDQRDPNGQAFQTAFTAALENKYAAEYVDEQGNTRRRAIISQPPQQQAPQASNEFSFEQFQGAVNGLGAQGAADWLNRNGLIVTIQDDSQFNALPSGAQFRAPDGTIRRKP